MAPADDDQPATKGDLRDLVTNAKLEANLEQTKRELVLEIGDVVQRALGINAEQFAAGARAIDEKYQDLPARVTAVERTLEAHAADSRLHKRPSPTAPKRRTKPR